VNVDRAVAGSRQSAGVEKTGHSGGKIVLDNISIRTFRTAAASQIRKSTACLPPTIALLKRAAPWIRHVYLNHLTGGDVTPFFSI